MTLPFAQSIQNHPGLLHDESQLAGQAEAVYFPRTATEVGGCSDGPEVVDLKKRIYWTC